MDISGNLRFSRDVACACACAQCAPRTDDSPRRFYYPILRHRLKALIIDGSEFQRIYHGTLLSTFGVDTFEVKNAYEALVLILRGIVFDVIFIDMDLAYLNGASTTRILRRLGVRSKIIGIAVYRNRESDQLVFIRSGLNDYYDQLLTYERLHAILCIIRYGLQRGLCSA